MRQVHIPPFLLANVWFSTRKRISAAKVTWKRSRPQYSRNETLWNRQGAAIARPARGTTGIYPFGPLMICTSTCLPFSTRKWP